MLVFTQDEIGHDTIGRFLSCSLPDHNPTIFSITIHQLSFRNITTARRDISYPMLASAREKC